MNVPKNIMGRIKIKESPVADPGFFAMVATIKPNPTTVSENNPIIMNTRI